MPSQIEMLCDDIDIKPLYIGDEMPHSIVPHFRAHPAISHLLLKCRVATNISHWLKVQSSHIFAKSVF